MYAIKRQFRIWKHELLQFWDKIPFYGRIILGASISVWLSIHIAREYIQPLNEEVLALSKDLAIPENLDPTKDEEIIMNKDKAKNLQPAIKRAEAELQENKKKLDILSENARFEAVNDFQKLFARCNLKVITEQSLDAAYINAQAPKKTSSKSKKSSKRSATPPPSTNNTQSLIASKDYQYKVLGSFRQIQAFLLLSETLKWRFQISDMSINTLPNSYGNLEFSFKLSIYYFK